MDRFVFSQEDRRWVWKRVNEAGNVLRASAESFPYYLQCVADAKVNGFERLYRRTDISSPNHSDQQG